jgi:hypothetical protein
MSKIALGSTGAWWSRFSAGKDWLGQCNSHSSKGFRIVRYVLVIKVVKGTVVELAEP